MITVTKAIYNFSELDERTQEKVIENNYDINILDDWYDQDGLLDLSAEEIKNRRIKMSKNWYEVQGNIPGEYPAYSGLINYDILGFDLDRGQYIQFDNIVVRDDNIFRKWLRIPKRVWEKVSYNFVNERKSNTEIEFDDISENGLTEKEQGLLDRAVEIFSDKVHESWAMLRDQYEYLQTADSIIDTINANNYMFYEDGTQIKPEDYPSKTEYQND